jgi:hypothetical protein
MRIGGMFCLEDITGPENTGGGTYLDVLGKGGVRLCMSGRCALYYCLLDLRPEDKKRVAYLPAYTCETVIAPYKKAGYSLCFYDVAPENLTPRFDHGLIPRISVLALCGYYGFSSYDRNFVKECADSGVTVIQDITHSAFSSDGIEERAAYIAGSLRKWIGIPSGGIALKRRGEFTVPLLPPETEHIAGRLACFEEQRRLASGEAGASEDRVNALFWKTETRLRGIFDAYESDDISKKIIERCPYRELIRARRENYRYILERNPFNREAVPVFPELPDEVCPCHLALYAENRAETLSVLAEHGVKAAVYWPFHGEIKLSDFDGAAYIYDHIYSVPVDQRYSAADMSYLCDALSALQQARQWAHWWD